MFAVLMQFVINQLLLVMFFQKNAILIAPNFATHRGVRGAEGPGDFVSKK